MNESTQLTVDNPTSDPTSNSTSDSTSAPASNPTSAPMNNPTSAPTSDSTSAPMNNSMDILSHEIFRHRIPLLGEFYQSPYNKLRRTKLMLFCTSLSDYEEYLALEYEKQMSIIKRLEKSCYNYCIDKSTEEQITSSWETELFCDLYHSICYKINSNIEKHGLVKNPYLSINIINDNIDFDNLPKMSSMQLFPEKYADIAHRISMSKNIVQTIKTSSLYHCNKCKQNRCSIENRYNRSLDEGTNLTITCMNCSNSWNA